MLLQNNPKHHPSTTVLASCYEYELFVLIHCVWFLPNIVLYFKYLYISPVCPKESSGSFKFSDTEFLWPLHGQSLGWSWLGVPFCEDCGIVLKYKDDSDQQTARTSCFT